MSTDGKWESIKSNVLTSLLIVILAVIVVVIYNQLYIVGGYSWGVNWVDDPMGKLGAVSGGIILTSALLDQFIEFFFMKKKGQERADLVRKIKERERVLELLKAKIIDPKKLFEAIGEDNKNDNAPKEDETAKFNKVLEDKRTELSKLDQERTKEVRNWAFGFGLLLTLAGIRVLTPLIELPIDENLKPDYECYGNLWIIIVADILFTAALLSGGASFVSKFFTRISDKM